MITILALIGLFFLYKYFFKKTWLTWVSFILLTIAGGAYFIIEIYILSSSERILNIMSSPGAILFVAYIIGFFVPWLLGFILLLVDIVVQSNGKESNTIKKAHNTKKETITNNVVETEEDKRKRIEFYKKEQNIGKSIYRKCREKNILDINDDNIEALKLIAKNYGVEDIKEAKAYFYLGRTYVTSEEDEDIVNEAKKAYMKENECFLKIQKEANIKGKDKYLELLKTRIGWSYSSYQWNQMDIEDDLYFMNKKHKDKNWALRGAIASSIGGTAVGVATALKTQQENEEHRKKVAKYKAEAKTNYNDHLKKKKDIEKEALDLQKKCDYINDRLIDIDNKEEKFELLEISNTNYIITEGKNFKVSFKYKLKDKIALLDSPAILDGSLLIEVLDGNRVLAYGYYVANNMDDWGDTGKRTIELNNAGFKNEEHVYLCLCRSNMFQPYLDNNKKYTIKISPHNLWIIEK